MVIKCKKRKIEVFEMMCLGNICDIQRVDRLSTSLVRERCRYEFSVLKRMGRNVLKWFCHMEKMAEEINLECIRQLWMVTGGEGDH